MTLIFEDKDRIKARQFAQYGISQLDENDSWFGMADFKRVLSAAN